MAYLATFGFTFSNKHKCFKETYSFPIVSRPAVNIIRNKQINFCIWDSWISNAPWLNINFIFANLMEKNFLIRNTYLKPKQKFPSKKNWCKFDANFLIRNYPSTKKTPPKLRQAFRATKGNIDRRIVASVKRGKSSAAGRLAVGGGNVSTR